MSSKKDSVLLNQISSLKKRTKEQEKLLKTYEEVLKKSNKDIERITQDLQDSLALISSIHRQLIPTELPKIPHFKFSYKFLPTSIGVSGDFFDIIPLKDPLKFGVLLSSCNTYAITSLFLSTILKSSTKLKEIKSSKDFMIYLADCLHDSFPKKESIHLFFGVIDRRRFTLDYCIAGDVFAGLKTADSVSVLKPSSKILHKDFKTSFKSKTIDLNPKNALILCSPGVIQKENQKGKHFGLDQIVKSISKKSLGVLEIRQNILFKVRQFGKGKASTQDQTVLVIKVKDRILKLTKKA